MGSVIKRIRWVFTALQELYVEPAFAGFEGRLRLAFDVESPKKIERYSTERTEPNVFTSQESTKIGPAELFSLALTNNKYQTITSS